MQTGESLDGIVTVSTPQQLAERFRRSGGFDQLRRELMASFIASDDKTTLDARLDAILPIALSRPSPKHVSKKDRHHALVADIDRQHTVLARVVGEVERALRAREREQENKGRKGALTAELDRTLRRSRGERIDDPPTARVSTSARSNGDGAHLPTPPHPDYLAPPAQLSTSASPASTSALSPLPLPLPTPEPSPLPLVPPVEQSREVESTESKPVVKEEERDPVPISLPQPIVELKHEGEGDVEMPPAS